MILDEIIQEQPKLHMTGSGKLVTWEISHPLKEYLYDTVTDQCTTLETGAGISTLIFSIKHSRHTCIAPDPHLIERIKEYCRIKRISLAKVDFQAECSETILPQLELPNLDLVLIDGRHGFPAPFIDWYYTAGPLKIGGVLIVDDVHLWTGKILKEFLLADPAWQLCENLGHRSVVFKKLEHGSEKKEWGSQPYVFERSRPKHSASRVIKAQISSATNLIRQRQFSTLAQKVKKNLSYQH